MTSLEIVSVAIAGVLGVIGGLLTRCKFSTYEDPNGEIHWSSSCLQREADVLVQEVQIGSTPILIISQVST